MPPRGALNFTVWSNHLLNRLAMAFSHTAKVPALMSGCRNGQYCQRSWLSRPRIPGHGAVSYASGDAHGYGRRCENKIDYSLRYDTRGCQRY